MSGVNEYLMPAPWGSIVLCEDNHELCEVRPSLIRVDMPTPAPEAVVEWMQRIEDAVNAPKATPAEVLEALISTQAFLRLSPFTQRVLTIVADLAPGQWSTYTEVARAAGNSAAARAVGQALALNPFPILIGCHRVCGAAERTAFDILKPESYRPQAYLGEESLAPVAQYLRLSDLSI